MEITSEKDKGIFRMAIKGEVDASSSINLDQEIQRAFENEQFHILFDCSHLEYISSAGLGVFVSYINDFKEKSGKFAFASLSPEVLNVFRMLGLHEVLFIGNSEEEAIDYLHEA